MAEERGIVILLVLGVIHRAWSLVPSKIQQDQKQKFGDGCFGAGMGLYHLRRDRYNPQDTLGAFSRLSPICSFLAFWYHLALVFVINAKASHVLRAAPYLAADAPSI